MRGLVGEEPLLLAIIGEALLVSAGMQLLDRLSTIDAGILRASGFGERALTTGWTTGTSAAGESSARLSGGTIEA